MQNLFYFLSGVFAVNTMILVGRKSFTLGLFIMFCISAGLFILGRWLDPILELTSGGAGLCLRYVFIGAVSIYLFLICFVMFFARSTTDYKEDAIIVLGCGLNRDGTPGPTLTKRLDGCIDYCGKNPDCVVVVTGGYSRFNNATEASAMKKYLVANGITEDRILVEEKASNTKENFENSLKLIKNKGLKTEKICYVTNSFHVYRSGMYARQAGISSPKVLSVSTDYAVIIPAVLREVCAVAAMMIFNY